MGAKETRVEPVKPKRVRRDPATTRKLILDETERLMVEEGYASVSSRRIAQGLGLNPTTIHYYYPATDDIFIALHERLMREQTSALEAVIAAENPLDAFWELQSNWAQTALGVEFVALSNHRKGLRSILAGVTDEARSAQGRALEALTASPALDPAILPPVALATILIAIARTLANEEQVGITRGHAEVRGFVAWALQHLRPG